MGTGEILVQLDDPERRGLGGEEATLQELGDRFGVTREAMRQAEVELRQRQAAFLKERLGDDVIRGMTGGG